MSRIVGEIKIWSSRKLPDGFLYCDGSQVSRAVYSALFAEIGTIYGAGDGSTSFHLPNCQDVTVMGLNIATGTLGSRDTTGNTGSHTHANTLSASAASVTANTTGEGSGSGSAAKVTDWGGSTAHTHTVTLSGGVSSANATTTNTPPNIRLPLIICYKGDEPAMSLAT